MTNTCAYCGKPISLIKAGLTEISYKWVTNSRRPKQTWKCPTEGFPIRGHKPKEEIKNAG